MSGSFLDGRGRVLVVKLGAFGDMVFADGALRDIREHHPGAHITLLTRRSFAGLLRRCPWVDKVLEDNNAPRWRLDRMAALRRSLVEGGFDLVYDLQNNRRTGFYRRWLLPHAVWSREARSDRNRPVSVTARHAAQLRAAGIDVRHADAPSPRWLCDDVAALLQQAGIARPFVALLPGSSARHPEKRWPHYAELSQRLREAGLTVVTVPGVDEADLGAGFAGIVLKAGDRVVNLRELASVLRAADVVVGNDSGPTHLAACLGTRCIALFDADNPARASTGIDARGICLVGRPLAALPVEAVAQAALAQCAAAG